MEQAPPAADLLVQTTSSQTISSSSSAGVQAVPAGVVADYAGLVAPSGWLLCDGRAVSRTTYSTLYAAISTTFGVGDGSTTFNLPDTVGRATVGQGPSGHADVQTVGSNDGVTQANRRPKHRHTPHTHIVGRESVSLTPGATPFSIRGNNATLDTNAPGTADGGSGTATDSLDAGAYIVFPKIIKT